MKHKLIETIVINGPMMVRVEGGDVVINAYQNEIRFPFEPKNQVNHIKGVLDHKKGPLSLILTSDIFDVIDEQFKLQDFEITTIKGFMAELLESSIQFIAKISKEEDRAVLIQNSYNEKSNYLLSTIGLLDDSMIAFAEIKEHKNKRKSK